MKRKTVIEMHTDDLDRLAQEVYGHNPEVIASEEWGNYQQHDIEADGQLDEYDLRALAQFLKTGRASYGIAHILLNDLVKGGKLEAGNYLLDTSW